MSSKTIENKQHLFQRKRQIEELSIIQSINKARIFIIYGRKNIGKHALIEKVFQSENSLRFKGMPGISLESQFALVMQTFSNFSGDPLHARISVKDWFDFFYKFNQYFKKGKWIVYFEELQWVANYKTNFIDELKSAWDYFLGSNSELVIVLSSSSLSYMIDNAEYFDSVLKCQYTMLKLQALTIVEAKSILKKKNVSEVFEAYLTSGGVPLYLNWLNESSSVSAGLCQHAFTSSGCLVDECQNLFTSQFSDNKHYKEIIELLSHEKFLTRAEISQKLKLKAGGDLTRVLVDLEKMEFISKYNSYNTDSNSLNARYCIFDAYLAFYYKFIKPNLIKIKEGEYDDNPVECLNVLCYEAWLDAAFARWCSRSSHVIANILGISSLSYKSGIFFNRATNKAHSGFQIDLVFDRDDGVITICLIKYSRHKVGMSVVEDMLEKWRMFPNKKNKSIHRVLVCVNGALSCVTHSRCFDSIINGNQLLDKAYW